MRTRYTPIMRPLPTESMGSVTNTCLWDGYVFQYRIREFRLYLERMFIPGTPRRKPDEMNWRGPFELTEFLLRRFAPPNYRGFLNPGHYYELKPSLGEGLGRVVPMIGVSLVVHGNMTSEVLGVGGTVPMDGIEPRAYTLHWNLEGVLHSIAEGCPW